MGDLQDIRMKPKLLGALLIAGLVPLIIVAACRTDRWGASRRRSWAVPCATPKGS